MTTPPSIYYTAPPRILLGAGLIIWGILTNHSILAFALTLLVEGKHWLNWRWEFDLKGYSRAWILSLIVLAGTVIFQSFNLSGPAAFLGFLEWLPVIFLPLILV